MEGLHVGGFCDCSRGMQQDQQQQQQQPMN
jgi:hypothetical protein